MARIYLASPYSDPDPAVCKKRVRLAEAKMIELTEAGNHVFSPVACSGGLVEHGCKAPDHYWYVWSMSFLTQWANVLCVYKIDGWHESKGIIRECNYAEEKGLPIIYL